MVTNAYLNEGRWVACCPACNQGWLVKREEPLILFDIRLKPYQRCLCGAELAVQFPAEFDQINEQLKKRQIRNRNWLPYESTLDLIIENVANGVSDGLDNS